MSKKHEDWLAGALAYVIWWALTPVLIVAMPFLYIVSRIKSVFVEQQP